MFLVEVESGQRCHYNTAYALGSAIRRGELGPQALIFHQTSGRWLPISVHPEYRKVESEREETFTRDLHGRRWTFLPQRSRPVEGAPSGAAQAPERDVMPLLVPEGSDASWLGSAFRNLMHLARPGA